MGALDIVPLVICVLSGRRHIKKRFAAESFKPEA
jgi:hypothetical protein